MRKINRIDLQYGEERLIVFYQALAKYYDDIFPAEKGKVSFLDSEFKARGVRKILDLACGTGSYALELARLGYKAWGIDLEPRMIELAAGKAENTGLPACFQLGDMGEPQALGRVFDGLFCIGNSLPHLTDTQKLREALQNMRAVLSPGGAAIFQIVNFDRILGAGDTKLPLIETSELRFLRMYRPQSERLLIFDSVLELKNEAGKITRLENSVHLYPLQKDHLEELLLAAGFADVKFYGNFAWQPYSPESQATVAVAVPAGAKQD